MRNTANPQDRHDLLDDLRRTIESTQRAIEAARRDPVALDCLTWAELSAAVDGILAELAKPEEFADARDAILTGFAEGMAAAQAEADAATIKSTATE